MSSQDSGSNGEPAMPIAVPTSSSPSQTPGRHASISSHALADKPHIESPPKPKSPMPPTASLAGAGSALMDNDGEQDGGSRDGVASASRESARGSSLQPMDAAQDARQHSSANIPSPPPEVEATLSKLTAHANVTGVLVLSRPEALVIRSGGSYFEPSGPGASDRAIRLKAVVTLVRNAVLGLERDVPKAESGDELSFLRIRTKKYEMMISPSDKYLLVVLQDPTVSS